MAIFSRQALMDDETHEAWVAAFLETTRRPVSARRAACPNCGYFDLAFQFVADDNTRAGFCALWCTRCQHGHTIGRVVVPAGIEFLPLDVSSADLEAAVPDFDDVVARALG